MFLYFDWQQPTFPLPHNTSPRDAAIASKKKHKICFLESIYFVQPTVLSCFIFASNLGTSTSASWIKVNHNCCFLLFSPLIKLLKYCGGSNLPKYEEKKLCNFFYHLKIPTKYWPNKNIDHQNSDHWPPLWDTQAVCDQTSH